MVEILLLLTIFATTFEISKASENVTLVRTAEEYPSADHPWRLNKTTISTQSTPDQNISLILKVNTSAKLQKILGFGGAITDAVAHVFSGLSNDLQEQVLESLWGTSGQSYNLARLTIGSTDFSTGVYNYNEPNGIPLDHADFNQSSFSVKHDKKEIIPLILRAINKTKASSADAEVHTEVKSGQKDLRFISTSWSPPGWMKRKYLSDRGHMRNSDKPGMLPGDQYAASYALYLSKYIQAYKDEGVNISMMTVQNEPDSADHMFPVAYPACNFNGTGEGLFLKEYLGPQMHKDHPDLALFIHDGQKFHDVPILERVDAIIKAAGGLEGGFIDGVAFHWYGNNLENYQYLLDLHHKYPSVPLLATEATLMAPSGQHVTTTPWKEAQKYGVDIIGDLNAGATGWIEWNVLLDETGGPTCIGATGGTSCTPDIGHCDAPILANVDKQELEYRDSYWIMGHFSRFLPRGSELLVCANSTSTELLFTAALTPENKLVVVVLNTDNKGRTMPTKEYQIEVDSETYIVVPPLPGHGLHTIIIDMHSLHTL